MQHHQKPWDENESKQFAQLFSKRVLEWLDNGYGSCILAQPPVGRVVARPIEYFDDRRYILDQYVIMPNHVHLLVKPGEEHSLSDLLSSLVAFVYSRGN